MNKNRYSLDEKEVLITTFNGKTFLIDIIDFDLVKKHTWCIDCFGYPTTRKDNTLHRLHRFIMKPNKNMCIDHINNDKSDNRRANLRVCSKAENNRNIPINIKNTSGYKGVSMHKKSNKWRARIMINSKETHIGLFNTREEAAFAYNKEALENYGEFAHLNII